MQTMMNLYNQVKALKKITGKTFQEVGNAIGLKEGIFTNYISDQTIVPSVRKLLKISEYFDISVDDLLYRDYTSEPYNPIKPRQRRHFPTQLRQLCKLNGIAQRQFYDDLDLNYNYIQQAACKGTMPRLYTALAIAEYFKISLDDLLYKDFSDDV